MFSYKFMLKIVNFVVIYTFLFIGTAGENVDEGFCSIESKSCGNNDSELRYLFYDVNPPEGFNLRRDVYMRFAIMLAEAQKSGRRLNWRLVLPPWHRLYHWKSQKYNSKPMPWNTFFNMDSLKSYAPVMDLHELFSKTIAMKFEIDRLYVLHNYENAFENGVFDEKWETVDDCKYDGNFWGYKNITAKEVECVNFQGKISMLWELVTQHPADKYVMFSHGEIPLHDTYGTKAYWDCRKSMVFNDDLVRIAKNFMSQFLKCKKEKCTSYVAIHWRRQDFVHSRYNDIPSIHGTAQQVHKAIVDFTPNVNKVFVATDASTKEKEKLDNELRNLGYKVYFYKPNNKDIELYKDGGVAIIEQIICSHAAYFIGTHESTFSFRIQEEREILGFDSSTTFNRLCPDSGKCEKPSKWTIVN
ncbi:GDP-fucose protein O-fucosyltransferase 2 [Battus philenor]|uniref:GDP-fucose protein O-fucosyltransferase 2 n=1 Tax=Battus philenor TaxID=42288 RepID=UPI0035CE9456